MGSIDVKEKMLTKVAPIEVIPAPSEEEAIPARKCTARRRKRYYAPYT